MPLDGEQPTVADQILKTLHRLTIATLVIGVVVIILTAVVAVVAVQSYQSSRSNRLALCNVRQNLQTQVAQNRAFLDRPNADAILKSFGYTRKQAEAQQAERQAQVDALDNLDCPQPKLAPSRR